MDGTAVSHRSAGTDGPGPGGDGGGGGRVGGWVVGARVDKRGGLLPAAMHCTPKHAHFIHANFFLYEPYAYEHLVLMRTFYFTNFRCYEL